jgi:hypothetical protein
MNDVVLLSEINPRGWMVPPLVQAKDWFGLLTDDEFAELDTQTEPVFERVINLIYERCAEAGKHLVIRDWSHLDFLALPFLDTQTNRLSLINSLQHSFTANQICLVRHPMDQYQSIIRLQIWQRYGESELNLLLRSMKLFAERAAKIGFIRYEEFVVDHEKELSSACKSLGIPFDRNYRMSWSDYDTITGNVSGSRGGTSQIQVLPRRHMPKVQIDYLQSSFDYQNICGILGYEP